MAGGAKPPAPPVHLVNAALYAGLRPDEPVLTLGTVCARCWLVVARISDVLGQPVDRCALLLHRHRRLVRLGSVMYPATA